MNKRTVFSHQYETLGHRILHLEEMPVEHQELYKEVKRYYDRTPSWNDFGNFWKDRLLAALKPRNQKEREALTKTSLFEICQDMESRIGIKQGYVRPADYRDYLVMIITEKFSSRYEFCKKVGMDQAFLSSVLKRKKDFSMKTLQQVLEKTGYEVAIREKTAARS